MVWCGVVWCGVVWCGVVRCALLCCVLLCCVLLCCVQFKRDAGDGGVVIDEYMRTSVADVYAAGDAAHAGWVQLTSDEDTHWFQMRLWSQAKTMGVYAARAMAKQLRRRRERREERAKRRAAKAGVSTGWTRDGRAEAAAAAFKAAAQAQAQAAGRATAMDVDAGRGARASANSDSDGDGDGDDDGDGAGDDADDDYGFDFELFAHATRFFGMKVVLLGRFQAQGAGREDAADGFRVMMRCEPGPTGHFVKLILRGGRLIGATLIGDTDLEEVFENLILNRIDLSRYGPELLDPDREIDDFFD
jgi:hypothetical protein